MSIFNSKTTESKRIIHINDKTIKIHTLREKYVQNINKNIGSIFFDITELKNFRITYITKPNFENFEKQTIEKKLKSEFVFIQQEEKTRGTTLIGPHLDDFLFLLEKANLKDFGSQGQQRMAIISLKLAEINFFFSIFFQFISFQSKY